MNLDTEKLVDNKILTLAGRLAIIAASGVFLPLCGWMLVQIYNAAVNISSKVDTQGVQIQLLEQSVKFGFDANKSELGSIRSQVNDHEGRIRVIERDTGRAPRPN